MKFVYYHLELIVSYEYVFTGFEINGNCQRSLKMIGDFCFKIEIMVRISQI